MRERKTAPPRIHSGRPPASASVSALNRAPTAYRSARANNAGTSALEAEADSAAEQVMRAGSASTPATPPVALATGSSDATHPLLQSSGETLDNATRGFMESQFGHDFSRVRVHAGPEAAASARQMDADAYTIGNHIAFDTGRYAPATGSGRGLLAHELTHVVQQASSGVSGIQRKVKSLRFQDEPTLEDVSEGKKVLKEGDKGEAVLRVTIALHELGHYALDIIDQSFDPPLTSAVSKYQSAKGISSKARAGKVDKRTFTALDQDFSKNHGVERDILSKVDSADLTKDTQTLDDDERTATARAISTEPRVDPVTGTLPTFKPKVRGKKYETRLKRLVESLIIEEYEAMGEGKAAAHADPTQLYDWATIEGIALEAQKAVDGVFGEYTKARPKPPAPLKQGVNIMDAWDDKVAQLSAGGTAEEDASAAWRVEKIITHDERVAALGDKHGVVQSRAAEAAIIDRVSQELITKHRAKLLETHKGWPGFADAGKIFIQRFKSSNDTMNRYSRWEYFQTFIHEYIHTLEHQNYGTYHGAMDEQKGGGTLREGTTDYFTKIVWNSVIIDDALRIKIEGNLGSSKKRYKVQKLNTYDQSENAERLAGIVGLRNLAAAFFLGKVELIGKK